MLGLDLKFWHCLDYFNEGCWKSA